MELAARLGKAQSFVSRLETGKVMETPGPDVLAALARELDVSVAEMLYALGYDLGEAPVPPRELPDDLSPADREAVLKYARYLAESSTQTA